MRFNGYGHPDNFDITNRPSNASLTRGFIACIMLSAIPGAIALSVIYLFFFSGGNPVSSVTLTLIIIGAIIGDVMYLVYNRRAGVRKRAEFIAAGGDPTGIKQYQFGVMGGERLPDGRWQWMKETVSTY